MKFTRMLSALFIAASLVLSMHSAASADHLQDIKARGTLRVAIPQDYPPFGFMGPDKQLKGYDIEMAGIVAKALGVKCELVPVTGANRIPFLLSNRADIVISTLGKTKERQKVIDFSIAYAATYSGVFGPEKMNVTKPEDLKGHTISSFPRFCPRAPCSSATRTTTPQARPIFPARQTSSARSTSWPARLRDA